MPPSDRRLSVQRAKFSGTSLAWIVRPSPSRVKAPGGPSGQRFSLINDPKTSGCPTQAGFAWGGEFPVSDTRNISFPATAEVLSLNIHFLEPGNESALQAVGAA